MSRNQLIRRQINQINFLLSDLRKVKTRCFIMADEMKIKFINKQDCQKLQREVQLKASILDYARVLQLKNKLINALDELFQTQAQLSNKHRQFVQKGKLAFSMKKNQFCSIDQNKTLQQQFGTTSELSLIEQQRSERESESESEKSIVLQNSNSNRNPSQLLQINNRQNINEIKTKTIRAMNKMAKRVSGYQIPTYTIRRQSAQNKLDSILKFVASLKRDMKRQTCQFQQSNGRLSSIVSPFKKPDYSWNLIQKQQKEKAAMTLRQNQRIKNILMLQPEYLKVREAYERMQMKYQEIVLNIDQRIQRQVQKRVTQIIEKQKKIIFNSKDKLKKFNQQDNQLHSIDNFLSEQSILKQVTNLNNQCQYSKQTIVLNKNTLLKQESVWTNTTKKQDIKVNCNQGLNGKNRINKSFQIIRDEVQCTQQRINALRAKRKKAFQQDGDLWNQIQSIQ